MVFSDRINTKTINCMHRRSTFKIIFFAVSASIVISLPYVFAQEEPMPFTGETNSDNINIRTDSTVSSEIICNIDKGKYVKVVSERYGWYKIKLPKNAPSFIKKNFINTTEDNANTSSDNPQDSNTAQNRIAKLAADRVNIRLRPDQGSAVLGKTNKEETITILEDNGDWYKIEPTDNSFGWINKKFVVKADLKPVTEPKPETDKQQPTQETPPADNNLTIEGTIRPHGIIKKRILTHKLITHNSNIFLLKGDKDNLDSLNYRKVRVIGKFMTDDKSKYPVIAIDKIETLD